MASLNDIVDLDNHKMLHLVPGNLKESYSAVGTCVEEEDQARYDADILNHINPSGLPHRHLQLNSGALIILYLES